MEQAAKFRIGDLEILTGSTIMSTSTSKSMSTRMSGVLGGNDKIRMTKLEAMTNAPMTNNHDRAYSIFTCHAVAEGVGVAVGVAVAVGVGVGVPPTAAKMSTRPQP